MIQKSLGLGKGELPTMRGKPTRFDQGYEKKKFGSGVVRTRTSFGSGARPDVTPSQWINAVIVEAGSLQNVGHCESPILYILLR